MIILFTKNNLASANIAKKLIENHGFDKKTPPPSAETTLGQAVMETWEREGVLLIDTAAPTVLDVPTDFDTDCLIVLSTHKSKTPGKMLTAHVPGNWDNAEMGGEPKTLNIAHGLMLKKLIRALDKANRENKLDWPVSLESDHHGPTCEVPILFVEIGNGEEQWGDDLAAEVVADAVAEAVFGGTGEQETDDLEPETVFGVGGGHYQRAFTKLLIETDIAVGHMAPKYAIDSMDEEMFTQAVLKNVGEVRRVLILKDETNGAQKEKIRTFAKGMGLEIELV
ncbi:MAG: D-aminoacyl-tRNA deacylase [Candidatus Micrarchaeota archaeon]